MTQRIGPPEEGEFGPFYRGYVERVPPGDIITLLARQIEDTAALLARVPPEREDHAYAAGKWSIREVVGHLADVERIMSSRAVRVARGDTTPMPGFDEDAYVATAGFGHRGLADLLAELRSVREASLTLFRGLPAAAWTCCGVADGQPVSVRALAYIVAGHELHHRAVLEERYRVGKGPPTDRA